MASPWKGGISRGKTHLENDARFPSSADQRPAEWGPKPPLGQSRDPRAPMQ